MTLEEAIQLANSGNIDMIRELGIFYFQNDDTGKIRDFFEALKWLEMGAEKGDIPCATLATDLQLINAITLRNEGIFDNENLEILEKANRWNEMIARNSNDDYDENKRHIFCERAFVYYLMSNEKKDIALLRQAVTMMKQVLPSISTTDAFMSDVCYYLARAINDLYRMDSSQVSEQDLKLEFQLLNMCISNYSEQLGQKKMNVVYFDLAELYTYGRGVKADAEMAVRYYQIIMANGFDCGAVMSLFKKDMFGRWHFKK